MADLVAELFGLFLFLGPALILLTLALFVGRAIERKHFEELDRREAATQQMLVSQIRSYTSVTPGSQTATIVVSEVVISSDYLKTFLGSIRNLFGGDIRSFETLLERARREGILRLKEQAIAMGYNAICCVRINTADLGGNDANRRRSVVMAALLLSGTAYHSTHAASTVRP